MMPPVIPKELRLFAYVGAAGFVVDGTVLVLLYQWLDWSILPSRILSFSVAASVTWLLNRRTTFFHRKTERPLSEWARYVAVNAVGGLLNLFLFIWMMNYLPGEGLYPLLALGCASGVALTVNFVGSKYVAFSRLPNAL